MASGLDYIRGLDVHTYMNAKFWVSIFKA